MPLPLTAEDLRRFLEEHQAPGPHLDFLHTVSFRAAGAAVELGVFEALQPEQPRSVADVAAELKLDERGLGQLLQALVGFGYVTGGPEGYQLTPLAAKWLRDVPGSYLTVFSFWQTILFELWTDLEQSVRTGAPTLDFYQWLQERPDTLRRFQTMLSRLASHLFPEVLETTTVGEGDRRLLDIGGGHATYAIGFCQRYAHMNATVLDLPAALEVGAEAVARAGLSDRIRLQPGDLRQVPGDEQYDLALLFNIVHGYGPQAVRELLRDVAAVTRPGGRVVLLEPLTDMPAGVVGRAFVGTFSLNLFHSQGGQVYSYDELAAWLREAGFGTVERHTFRASPTDHLITGVRS